MAADLGLIRPRLLRGVALDAVSRLLNQALRVASTGEDCKGQLLPLVVRRLLGLVHDHRGELDEGEATCLTPQLATQLICRLAEDNLLTRASLSCFCKCKLGAITRINVSGCLDLDPLTLVLLLQHPLLELSLSISATNPTSIRWHHLELLSSSPAASTLRRLTLQCSDGTHKQSGFTDFSWLVKLKALVHLDLHDMRLPNAGPNLSMAIRQLPKLVVLNIAGTSIRELQCGDSLLKGLFLCGLPTHNFLDELTRTQTLVSLDISYWRQGVFAAVSAELDITKRLSTLPNLKYLDVAGHLLFAADLVDFDPPHHRMSYLGLLATEACKRAEINSDKVSGVCVLCAIVLVSVQ